MVNNSIYKTHYVFISWTMIVISKNTDIKTTGL